MWIVSSWFTLSPWLTLSHLKVSWSPLFSFLAFDIFRWNGIFKMWVLFTSIHLKLTIQSVFINQNNLTFAPHTFTQTFVPLNLFCYVYVSFWYSVLIRSARRKLEESLPISTQWFSWGIFVQKPPVRFR